VGCKRMYGLVERARLLGHEKSFRRAVAYAAQSKHDAELLALSMCGGVCWLAGVVPGSVVCVRSTLSGLNPGRWNAVCANLSHAAQEASSKGNAAHHVAFALLAGVIDSRIIEVSRPSVAILATAFRDRAVAFADDLTKMALRLTTPRAAADSDEARALALDAALASQRLAEKRPKAKAGTAA
jgi:hypothetical protein